MKITYLFAVIILSFLSGCTPKGEQGQWVQCTDFKIRIKESVFYEQNEKYNLLWVFWDVENTGKETIRFCTGEMKVVDKDGNLFDHAEGDLANLCTDIPTLDSYSYRQRYLIPKMVQFKNMKLIHEKFEISLTPKEDKNSSL